MKTFKIVMIVIFSGLALCLCVMLGRLLAMGGSPETYPNYTLVQEKTFAAEEITALSALFHNSSGVFFSESADNTVTVKEYANFTPDEKQLSAIEQRGTTLFIEGPKRSFLSFSLLVSSSPDSYTEICLPENLLSSLRVQTISGDIRSTVSFTDCDDLSVSTTSGDIFFPALEGESLTLSSTSGNIGLERVSGGKLNISTTSGDIKLGQLSGKSDLSTTSGDIQLERLEGNASLSGTSSNVTIGNASGSIDISTVSGDIRLDNMSSSFRFNTTSGNITVCDGTGYGSAGTVSGDIRIFLSELTDGLTLSTTSGNVSLALPETASYTLDFDSTSGGCNTFFDGVLSFSKKGNQANGQYGNNAGNKLNISTVSGDLSITKYIQ